MLRHLQLLRLLLRLPQLRELGQLLLSLLRLRLRYSRLLFKGALPVRTLVLRCCSLLCVLLRRARLSSLSIGQALQ